MTMKPFKFDNQKLYFKIGKYSSSNSLLVQCRTTNSSYFDITVDIPNRVVCCIDEGFVDLANKNDKLYQALINEGIIYDIIKENVVYDSKKLSLVRFDLDKLKKYDMKGYYEFLDSIGFEESILRLPKL